MRSNQFKVGKLKAFLFKKERVWIRVCVRWKDMAGKEEEMERTEIQAFLQLLTTGSDNMEVPPICLTAFQWSSTALFKTKSSTFLKSLMKWFPTKQQMLPLFLNPTACNCSWIILSAPKNERNSALLFLGIKNYVQENRIKETIWEIYLITNFKSQVTAWLDPQF